MWNPSPCRKVVVFRPELSSRLDWFPIPFPIFLNILCILVISVTVPTYGTVIDVFSHEAERTESGSHAAELEKQMFAPQQLAN